MRGALFVVLCAVLSLTAACARQPLRARAAPGVLVASAASTGHDAIQGLIEMPPLFVDGRESYRLRVERAAAAATAFSARQLSCPAVHVRRADHYIRADGTPWTVVRVNACGEEHVYEQRLGDWQDATARLR